MDGHSLKPAPYVKQFDCPNCGASIHIRSVGSTINAVCSQCGALIDTSRDDYKILDYFNQATENMHIELGARGTLNGIEWEMIGFVQRYDEQYLFTWQEYLLFNPKHGYRFLVESDGHWSLVQLLRTLIKLNTKSFKSHPPVRFQNNDYKIYHIGYSNVSTVIGEFYWRVKTNDQVRFTDYISPPYSLTQESTPQEETWSQGEYLSKETLEKGFHLKKKLPTPKGIGQLQPNPFPQKLLGSCLLFILSFLILCGLSFIEPFYAPTRVLYTQSLVITPQNVGKEIQTASFPVHNFRENIDINIQSDVQNNWSELAFELVNDATGATAFGTQTIEYYTGSDSDGTWTEGSQSNSVTINGVEKGQYHLIFTPTMSTQPEGSSRPVTNLNMNLSVVANKPSFWNFIWAFIAMCIYPIWVAFRAYSFESNRWRDSDFSPYISSSEDDE